MRVLFINTVCYGSTGHIVQDLARQYLAEGDECTIAYGRGEAPQGIPSYRIGTSLSVNTHVLLTRLFDAHGSGSRLATRQFIKWIRQYNPDLIWLHNIHGYYLNVYMLFDYLRESGVQVKWTLHDCWSFTGHCPHFERVNCQKWKTGCRGCPLKKEYPASFVFSNAAHNYRQKKQSFTALPAEQMELVTPSVWLANLAAESFLGKYRTTVVHNTVDTSVFHKTESDIKEKYGIADKKVILGVASVWDHKKGIFDFYELAGELPDGFIIVLIGLSEKQMKELPNNILGIRRTESRQELVNWYSAAYCFFDPTYEDTYPTVLLEAKACGCPTYAYDTGGCGEIADVLVSDGKQFLWHLSNRE